MSKYTVEDKLQAVERYLTGNESYKNIAKALVYTKNLVIIGLNYMKHKVKKVLEKAIQLTHRV